MKKTVILINTDSACLHSGLAETTRGIFIPLLERYRDKYEIHQCGWFHLAAREQVPWPIYPTKINQTPQGPQIDNEDRYGKTTLPGLIEKIKPDIVFGYGDLWTFDHILDSPVRNQFRLVIYYTVDGQPYFGHLEKDGSTTWGKALARADKIVTLSHFGKDTLLDCCPEIRDKDISVRYHPLDLSRFPPRSREQILDIRSKLLPKSMSSNSFLCGWLGRNQFRKQNYKLWELQHYMVYGDYIECKDCNRISIKEWNHSGRRTKDPNTGKRTDVLTLYDQGYDYSYCWHCKSSNIQDGQPDPDFYLWLHMSKNDPGYNPDLHERMWMTTHRSIYTTNTNGLVGISREDVAALLSCWDVMYYPSGGEGYGNPCQTFDTLVNTDKGPRKIGCIGKGDKVFTHTGHVREVTGSTKRSFNGELIGIRPRYGGIDYYTPNHPLLVFKNGDDILRWTEAKGINKGDFLAVPKVGIPRSEIVLDLMSLVPGLVETRGRVHYPMSYKTGGSSSYSKIAKDTGYSVTSVYRVANGIHKGRLKDVGVEAIKSSMEKQGYSKPDPVSCSRYQALDEELMDFLGLYMAEGSGGAKGQAVDIAGHKEEIRRQDLCKSIADRFGARMCTKDHGNGRSCIISSKLLLSLCRRLIGSGSSTKSPDYSLLGSDNLWALLRGYFDGDGCHSYNYTAHSTSDDIIEFVRLALNSYGIYMGAYIQRKLQKNANFLCHKLAVPPQYNHRFEEVVRLNKPRVQRERTRSPNSCLVVETDDYFLVPVASISRRSYNGYVYNLHVAIDESYLVRGVSSHNCAEALAAGTPLIFSNYSAHAEFCMFGGLPVRVTYIPENHHGIMRSAVDTNHAIEQMLKLRRDRELRERLGQSGRAFMSQFSTVHMVSSWDKIFTDAMSKPLPIEGDKLYAHSV